MNVALNEEIQGKRVKVLPLLLEDCVVPPFLAEKIFADFRGDFDHGLRRLLQRFARDRRPSDDKRDLPYQRLEEAWRDWNDHERVDAHLLSPREITVALEHLTDRAVPIWLLKYLLRSAVSHAETQRLVLRGQLRIWTHSLDTHERPDLCRDLLGQTNVAARLLGVSLFEESADVELGSLNLEAATTDESVQVRRRAMRAVAKHSSRLLSGIAGDLFEKEPDWIVRSSLLSRMDPEKTCLVISDDTDFARDLADLTTRAGFRVVEQRAPGWDRLDEAPDDVLDPYALVMLVRGEEFGGRSGDKFYSLIRRFVVKGGTLFATCWSDGRP